MYIKSSSGSSKAKIAQRVVEVFEFLADGNAGFTVNEIVAQYDRPLSSTSELLCAVKEMGLLYRDQPTRRYYPTPRLAAL